MTPASALDQLSALFPQYSHTWTMMLQSGKEDRLVGEDLVGFWAHRVVAAASDAV